MDDSVPEWDGGGKFSVEKIQNALISLENLDWNILSLGGKIKTYKPQLINDYLLKTASEYCHSIVYNGVSIDKILDTVKKSLVSSPRVNLDRIYTRDVYGIGDKCYMTKDLCILQGGDDKSNKRTGRAKKAYKIKMRRIGEY
jgi:hypothetical protein